MTEVAGAASAGSVVVIVVVVVAIMSSSATPSKRFCIEMPLPRRAAIRRRDANARARALGPSRAAFFSRKLWPNGTTLRCRFLGGTKVQQAFVKRVASEWTRHANLHFEWLDAPGASDLRIDFREGEGSWSYVGTDNRSIPQNAITMNLGWLHKRRPRDSGTVLHEFGHAIGLVHEHLRERAFEWNREAVIASLSGPPNYWDEEAIEHNVLSKLNSSLLNATDEIDDQSIMMYPFPAEWTLSGQGTEQNEVLSPQDKEHVRFVYPRAPEETREGSGEVGGERDPEQSRTRLCGCLTIGTK